MKIQFRFFHVLVILISLAFFFIQAGDFGLRLNTQLADVGDSVLNAWILAWDAHALFNPSVSIWDAPIFYPVKGTLAFSENLFGNLWITLPIQLLTGNHVLAANGLALVSFVLGSYFTFLLVKELTGSSWGGLAAGLIFSFNPYRWGHLAHLQLMPFFWAPLALLFANRFVNTKNFRDFWKALLFTWIQYYASVYLGTMLLTLLISLFLTHLVFELGMNERLDYFRNKKTWGHFSMGAFVSALILLPIGIPYLQVALKWNFFRTLDENALYSAELLGFIFPPHGFANYSWLKNAVLGHITADKGETAVFLGFLPYFLAILALYFLKKKYAHFPPDQKKTVKRYAVVSAMMALIMLGPFASISSIDMPMPFLLVYKLIPGGSAMRVPARFAFPFLLTLSVLCGFSMALIIKILRDRSKQLQVGVFGLMVTIFLFEYQVVDFGSGHLKAENEFPKVYQYIKESPEQGPVLELPINRISKFMYLHYQTGNWRPAVGGFSGWEPSSFMEMNRRVKKCYDKSCYKLLKLIPFQTLVVHLDRLDFYGKGVWKKADLKPYGFKGPKVFDSDLVWEKEDKDLRQEPPKLKTSPIFMESDNYGIVLILNIEPDEMIGWRSFLQTLKFQFTIETKNGKKVGVEKNLKNPHYIIPNDPKGKITGVFTRFGVELKDVKSILIEGPQIISKKYAREDFISFNPLTQSSVDQIKLKSKISSLAGVKNNDKFKQGQKLNFDISVKNMGESNWLDLQSNAKLYDTVNGSVFLTTRWFKNEGKDLCSRAGAPLKEIRLPIESMIAPGDSAFFRIGDRAPDQIGKYSLVFGLTLKSRQGFDNLESDFQKCVSINVEAASNPYSYGNLARFFNKPATAQGKASLEKFKNSPRDNQIDDIIISTEIIASSGGPEASRFNPKDLHLRKKVLEIAEFIKNELDHDS